MRKCVGILRLNLRGHVPVTLMKTKRIFDFAVTKGVDLFNIREGVAGSRSCGARDSQRRGLGKWR